tara:strand:- start:3570 stop:4151 length:582 start_codon:yes stop_codon:yes gene_type:complete
MNTPKVDRKFNLKNLKLVSELVPDEFECFIMYGTLLSYEREGNIFEKDDDIDFLIHKKHRQNLINIFHNHSLSSNIKCLLNINVGGLNTNAIFQVINVYDDIPTFIDFYFYEESENFITDLWTTYENSRVGSPLSIDFPKEKILPISKTNIQGIPINVPSDIDFCCEFVYGKNYMTPLEKDEYQTFPCLKGKL